MQLLVSKLLESLVSALKILILEFVQFVEGKSMILSKLLEIWILFLGSCHVGYILVPFVDDTVFIDNLNKFVLDCLVVTLLDLLVELFNEFLHSDLEIELPSRLKVKIWVLDYGVWDKSKVKEDHDHVRLLASDFHLLVLEVFVVTFSETIFDEFFSLTDECTNVIEQVRISWIGENLIPWSSLNGFLWHLGVVKSLNGIWIGQVEQEVVLHVSIFLYELVSLGELDTLEEVGEILVDINLLTSHCKTPLHKVSSTDLLDGKDKDCASCHEEYWCSPVDSKVQKVI